MFCNVSSSFITPPSLFDRNESAELQNSTPSYLFNCCNKLTFCTLTSKRIGLLRAQTNARSSALKSTRQSHASLNHCYIGGWLKNTCQTFLATESFFSDAFIRISSFCVYHTRVISIFFYNRNIWSSSPVTKTKNNI